MRGGRSDRNKNTSKFISLILRHKPETIGITLDFRARCTRWTGEKYVVSIDAQGCCLPVASV